MLTAFVEATLDVLRQDKLKAVTFKLLLFFTNGCAGAASAS